jgi:hypothetical protein
MQHKIQLLFVLSCEIVNNARMHMQIGYFIVTQKGCLLCLSCLTGEQHAHIVSKKGSDNTAPSHLQQLLCQMEQIASYLNLIIRLPSLAESQIL